MCAKEHFCCKGLGDRGLGVGGWGLGVGARPAATLADHPGLRPPLLRGGECLGTGAVCGGEVALLFGSAWRIGLGGRGGWRG